MDYNYNVPTYEDLLKRMMDEVPDSLDKREGSMVYNALAPAAAELAQLYIQLRWMIDQSFPDTADRHHLIRRAIERGIRPYPATAAVLRAHLVPEDLPIPQGARFNLDDINYKIIENEETPGMYKIECETVGTIGNKSEGELIPIEYIPGLESAHINSILTPGEDAEPTEEFRERYMRSFDGMAYGGNIADYKNKVAEIRGVGAVKVIPIWDGGGTVKIIILGGDNTVPSEELVQEVQTILDPVQNGGEGVGVAPVGHRVTVEGAVSQTINVGYLVTPMAGYNYLDLEESIKQAIREYFRWETAAWEDRAIVVRLAQIQHVILELDKVDDVKYVTLNGVPDNLTLPVNVVPVLGTVSNDGTPLKKV